MPLWGERRLIPLLFRAITEEREAEMEKKVHCELPGKNRAGLWRGLAGGSLATETVRQVGNELIRSWPLHAEVIIIIGEDTYSLVFSPGLASAGSLCSQGHPVSLLGFFCGDQEDLFSSSESSEERIFLLKEFWWNGIQLRLLQAVGWIAIGLCSCTNVNKSVFRRKRNVGDCFSHQNKSM